mgnify:CR=1 FL=1
MNSNGLLLLEFCTRSQLSGTMFQLKNHFKNVSESSFVEAIKELDKVL